MLILSKIVTLTSALLVKSGLKVTAPHVNLTASSACIPASISNGVRMASTLDKLPAQAGKEEQNVFQRPLQVHNLNPKTGFLRDGYCRPHPHDPADHTLAGIVSKEFLEFSKKRGNDLTTPHGDSFPGLTPGCRWCLCVSRWKEAYDASKAYPNEKNIVPKVDLSATSISVLNKLKLEQLKEHEWREPR